MTSAGFEDDATSIVDETLLAEIRAEAARRGQAVGAEAATAPSADPSPHRGDARITTDTDHTDLEVPTLEGYGALREIGRGGFSRVYEALQFGFERWVAIKILNETLNSDDEIAEFERECRLMGVLSRHPNIVTVLDSAFTADGLPCIVMELFPNGSYVDVLQATGPLGLEETLSVAVSIAGALATAHHQGVVHGDVKPQNIFRSEFGAALGDFGIASLINHGFGPAKTRLSLYYAAPEVIERGAAALSPFSDQYSLAATLYTLATGERPFQASYGDSTRDLLLEALTAPVPRLGDEFPTRLADALQQAMTREPAHRHRDMRSFAAAVGEVETDLGYRPTDLRILTGSGRFAAQVPGESRSYSRDVSGSRDLHPSAPAAGTVGSHSGPLTRTGSGEVSAEYGDMTIVRPPRPSSQPQGEDPPAEPARKRPPIKALVAVAGLLLAIIVAAIVIRTGGDEPGQADMAADVPEPDAAEVSPPELDAAEVSPPEQLEDEPEPPTTIPENVNEVMEVPAPQDLTLEPGTGALRVSWAAPDQPPSEIIHYRIEWAAPGESFNKEDVELEKRLTIVRPVDRTTQITELQSGTEYTVRVAAQVSEGLGEWVEARASPLGLPTQPTIILQEETHRAIILEWRAPEDEAQLTGYELEWTGSDGSTGSHALAPGADGSESLGYQITGLVNGIEYVVEVFAVSEAGRGEPAVAVATPVNPMPVRVAYSTNRDGRIVIYMVRPDGTDPTPLALDDAGSHTARGWSPDRIWIVAEKQIPGNDWDITVVNVLTGEERTLTCNALNDWGAAWSPDGSRIAFVRDSDDPYHNDIYMLDVTSGVETRITNTSDDDGLLSWSPDSTKIAFTRRPRPDDSSSRSIWISNVTTGDTRRLASSDGDLNAPSWSPDGTKIALARGYGHDRDIVTVNADGSGLAAVTSGGHHDDEPTWSPDGTKIAFARGLPREDEKPEQSRNIYVVDVASGQVRPLVENKLIDDWSPVWSPNEESSHKDIAVDPYDCSEQS